MPGNIFHLFTNQKKNYHMNKILKFDKNNIITKTNKNAVIDFLFQHLDQFGDPKSDIYKAVEFVEKYDPPFGGYILVMKNENEQIIGSVIVNSTGMKDYIPENILVYIAVHGDYRGKGLGKKLMKRAIEEAEGNIALHVEPDNPAKFLYENIGFKNKYLEMRYIKQA